MDCSIVIPAYNEAANIGQCIRETNAAAEKLFASFELIVVDDGSRDDTLTVARGFLATHPRLQVLSKPNGGIGSAVTFGLRHATGKLLTYTPADNQFEFLQMARLLEAIVGHDIAIGCKEDYKIYSRSRRFLSGIGRLTMRLLFGVVSRDVNFIHLYRQEAYRRIIPKSNGAFFHAETIARAVRQNMRIAQTTLSLRSRSAGESTGASWGTIYRTIIEMLRYLLNSKS